MWPLISNLEHTYQILVYGYNEPDILLASKTIAREYSRQTISYYEGKEWPSWLTKKDAVYTFNNSKVIECPLLKEDEWAFINIAIPPDLPHKERLSGLFSTTDLNWRPVTPELMAFALATTSTTNHNKETESMHSTFTVHRLNEVGLKKAEDIAFEFDRLLTLVEGICLTGRELALVNTHMEIACFYAKKAMAMRKENQLAASPTDR